MPLPCVILLSFLSFTLQQHEFIFDDFHHYRKSMLKKLVAIYPKILYVQNNQNLSKNIFDEAFCLEFYPPKMFILNVAAFMLGEYNSSVAITMA